LSLRHELRDKNQQIEQMSTELEAKSREIQRMDTAMRLLKVDHRVARIAVADQWTRPDNVVMTKLAFAEVNDGGALLEGFKTFTIEGDVVYIDSWVAKFADEHVENGVPLRSTSICLFRRLFGENQTPNEGFALDTVGSRPAAYSPGTELSPLEKEIGPTSGNMPTTRGRPRASDCAPCREKLRPFALWRARTIGCFCALPMA